MYPGLAVLALAVAAVAAAAAAVAAAGAGGGYDLPYRAVSAKDVGGFRPTDTKSFVIPSNQCSGFIDERLLCGAGGVAGAVRVEVRERLAFPSVRVGRQLRNATIVRAVTARGRCPGAAHVTLSVGCLVAPAAAPSPPPGPRRQRAVAPALLPPAPSTNLI